MRFLRPTLLALAIACTPAIASNDLPGLGDASSGLISPEQEYQLGRAWLNIVRGQIPSLDDPILKDFVERSVYRLSESSQLSDRRLEFVLLDSNQLNAFAAPGGIIGVNGGLFLYAETEAEYASVMAHELAHLSQRHFARGLQAQKNMQLPVMAAMLAGVVAAAAGAADAGIATIASAQAAAIQESRRFSRQNEAEADRIGIINLERAGFDPRGMPQMFERLMRQYRYSRVPPEFLLTHPVSESRIADTRNRAEQYPTKGRMDSVTYQLVRARVLLQYEETPGLALKRFRLMLEENPQHTAARYGLALAQNKGGQANEAEKTLAPLLQENPNDVYFNLAQVDFDLARNRTDAAEQRITSQLKLNPNNFPLSLALAELQLKKNQPASAEQIFDSLLKQRPNDPDIWYLQAETRGLAGNIIGVHQARAEYFTLVGDYDQAIEQLDFAKRRAQDNFALAARIDNRQQQLIAEQQAIREMMR
ncbi:Putative Zn-dependent protease, contains TPR repeats [Atopomonas hussainii]|uniref:Putative beta-barrel assembly-enhancing protease n=1 Tax=Atopomonas hussainii TaxID=1429083 RepID=A0A1H7S3F3_9GAMM|nr:M48 family metalloprotease [Atopomonas hussainii]SEL67171.1 Putative Zn-dependent protease, contains TPR repeats [Atopomonas hussainii]